MVRRGAGFAGRTRAAGALYTQFRCGGPEASRKICGYPLPGDRRDPHLVDGARVAARRDRPLIRQRPPLKHARARVSPVSVQRQSRGTGQPVVRAGTGEFRSHTRGPAPCSGEGRTGGQVGSTRELRRIRPRPMPARRGLLHPCACCIAPMHRSKQGRDGNRGRRRARTSPYPQAGANMVGKLLIWSAVYQARIGAMHNQACCTAKKVTILDPVRRRRHT